MAAGITGWSEKRLKVASARMETVTVNDHQHATYYPGAETSYAENHLGSPTPARLLGAQVNGCEGVDKRLDVLATAVTAGMTDRGSLSPGARAAFRFGQGCHQSSRFAACNRIDEAGGAGYRSA